MGQLVEVRYDSIIGCDVNYPDCTAAKLDTRNLTQYAQPHLRQGYISMQSALTPYSPRGDAGLPVQLQLRALQPVTFLQASILKYRVIT